MDRKISQTWKNVNKMTGTQNRQVRKDYLSIMTSVPQSVRFIKPSTSIAAVAPFINETLSSVVIDDNVDMPVLNNLMDTTQSGIEFDGMCFCFSSHYNICIIHMVHTNIYLLYMLRAILFV